MVKEMKMEKKSFWYWIIWIIILIMAFSIFSGLGKIEDLEYKVDMLESKINYPQEYELSTLYVEAEEFSDWVCCPVGYVRTGCTMSASGAYNSAVYPVSGECCEGYRVHSLWAICTEI